MNMKNSALLLSLAVGLLLFGCTASYGGSTGTNGGTNGAGSGHAVFAIQDAVANMGAVTSVKVQVDDVQVHSATQGWLTVTSTPHTYDLLQLKASNSAQLLADANLTPDTYDQMRLDVSNVVVTDASGTHSAKLPSGELKLQGELVVKANATTSATFDFLTDESLHVTGKGEYILAPVVKVETRDDADVTVDSDERVHVNNGTLHTSVKLGMDENGDVGEGKHIRGDADVEIEGDHIRVNMTGVLGGGASGNLGVIGGNAQNNKPNDANENTNEQTNGNAETNGNVQGNAQTNATVGVNTG